MKKITTVATTISVTAFIAILGFMGAELAYAATTVTLGSADSFAVLGFSGVTASTPSVVSGDVGLSPAAGTLYSGLTTGMVTGTIYAVDATGPAGGAGNNPSLLTLATGALATAFTNAGQAPSGVNGGVVTGDLGTFNGGTLTPGVYQDNGAPNSLAITGTLTLDGGGDPNAVFIFRSGSTLTTASNSHVTLTNGTQACNVFWQIGSSATLGTNSDFKGNILAALSITDNGGSTVEGRFLAEGGAVTLDNTHLTRATCASLPVAASGSASYWSAVPLIDIVKVPNPLALPEGPGSVTYTYTVTTASQNPLSAVWVIDNKCTSVQYVSGDTNNDASLQQAETWIYRCTKIVSQTETNTATAHGYSNSMEMYRSANATVVVGSPVIIPTVIIPPPAIVTPVVVGQVLGTSTPSLPDTGLPPREIDFALLGLIALFVVALSPFLFYFGRGMRNA
ncbi:MAG: ice-binding family protein [Candidatus Pacebacteria bacterium]|nr:ice-binding family protein [Candidatus Paceibacterota bacterium]